MSNSLSHQADAAARRSKRYLAQYWLGWMIVIALAVPSIVHSAAAIGTLRNLPVLWLPQDMEIRKDFFRFIEAFDVTDTVIISWPNAQVGDPSIAKTTRWLETLSREVHGVQSPEEVKADRFAGPIVELCDGREPFLWVRSGEDLLNSLSGPPLNLSSNQARRRLQGATLGPDGKQTCVVFSLDLDTLYLHRPLLALVREGVAESAGCPVEEVVMVGAPVDGAEIDAAAIRSITRFSLPSSLIAALLCFLALRSVLLTSTTVAIALIVQGMILACIYYAGYEMNAILMILPALVFVLTISCGIHLINYYLEALHAMPNAKPVDVVYAAMRLGYKPCTMSTMTTVVGLMSLLLVRIQPVQIFGIAASCALVFSLVMIFMMMPGTMLLACKRARSRALKPAAEEQHSAISVGLSRLLELPLRYQKTVFLLFAVLAGASALGLASLNSSVRIVDLFSLESPVNRSYRWFETHIGPTMSADLLVTFDTQEQVSAIDRYRATLKLHAAIAGTDGIGGVFSGISFLPVLRRDRGVRGAANRAVIRSMIEDESSRLYELSLLRKLGSEEVWRVSFRLNQTDPVPAGVRLAAVNTAIEKAIDELSEQQRPATALTGHAVIVEQTQKLLLEDLVRSFLAAFVVIAVFMSLMVGNPIGGLLSMIPNMIPTVVLFGLMGWCGYALDIGSVMTASVALGIAVDDCLHLLSHFRSARKRGLELIPAARDALKYCGMALTQTTVICGSALAIYYASEFQPTQRFAVFMGVLLVIAWLGVAFLLPAMMTSRLGRWFSSR